MPEYLGNAAVKSLRALVHAVTEETKADCTSPTNIKRRQAATRKAVRIVYRQIVGHAPCGAELSEILD